LTFGFIAALLLLAIASAALFWNSPVPVVAQDAQKKTETKVGTEAPKNPAEPAKTETGSTASATATPAQQTVPPASAELKPPASSEKKADSTTNQVAGAGAEPQKPSDEVQISFQGANIDMIVQWLAKTTGKSVVKHPQVQCQLTIVSSKGLTARDAINLVYRALALEGFSAIESSKSILLVPEGKEPKMSPELIPSRPDVPEGRQRLIKIFPLKSVSANELKEKLRGVLSEKGTIDADERANQVVVTDYNENIRLIGELIKELDITSPSDIVIELYALKHSEADDLANLLTLVLNAQAPPPGSQGRSAPSPGGPPPGGGPPMPTAPPPSGPSPGASTGSQQIRIWPDKTSNRLIVAAPKSKLPEVQKLLELLDTEKPQDVGLRVIPLKNVSAEDLVKEIGPLYQKMTGKSLKDMIEVTANSRSNSLIVLSSEENFKALQKLIAALDTEDAQEKVMQAFPLKNADAEDVAKQLQQLSDDQQIQSRYFYFYSLQLQ
jgi:type II secretory pathway component GspD/PulD (secretin)